MNVITISGPRSWLIGLFLIAVGGMSFYVFLTSTHPIPRLHAQLAWIFILALPLLMCLLGFYALLPKGTSIDIDKELAFKWLGLPWMKWGQIETPKNTTRLEVEEGSYGVWTRMKCFCVVVRNSQGQSLRPRNDFETFSAAEKFVQELSLKTGFSASKQEGALDNHPLS